MVGNQQKLHPFFILFFNFMFNMPLRVVILCIIIVGVRHQKFFPLLFFKFILWIYIHNLFLKIMFIVQKKLGKDNDHFSWLCLGLGVWRDHQHFPPTFLFKKWVEKKKYLFFIKKNVKGLNLWGEVTITSPPSLLLKFEWREKK